MRPGHQDVEDLGLGHRDPDVPEVRRILHDEELHHPLIGDHHALDELGVVRVGDHAGGVVFRIV